MGRGAARPARPSGLPPEVEHRLVREMKEKMYATWPDEPVPALGGLTPREAARKPSGRHRLDILLKGFEATEAGGEPAGRRFDVASLRRLLGLDRE